MRCSPARHMSAFNVSVQVLEGFDGRVSDELLMRVAEGVIAVERPGLESSLSVVLADDETVRSLNKQHRGLDESTDVLSFSFTHQGEYYGEREPSPEATEEVGFVLPPGEDEPLGDVVISYPQAERQAAQSGHAVDKELAVLLTHGILHLLGHDHEDPGEDAVMKRVEADVLTRVWSEA